MASVRSLVVDAMSGSVIASGSIWRMTSTAADTRWADLVDDAMHEINTRWGSPLETRSEELDFEPMDQASWPVGARSTLWCRSFPSSTMPDGNPD